MSKRKPSTFERLREGKSLNRQERRELERRLNAVDPGLDVIHPDAAGIDVGDKSHFVAVPAGRDPQPVREFGSWTAALREMAEWLKQCGIRTVVMQSTGVYWMAIHDVLQEYGLEVNLVDARGTKNVPGHKSDVQECQWLLKLHTYGLLRNCFLPPEEIRGVRTLWRLRSQHVADAGRCIQHMQKALIEMNVQLQHAVSDIAGVTGQAILQAMLDGERDPHKLAALRDPRCQASEEEIACHLAGNWREDSLFALEQAMASYKFYGRQMAACDKRLQRYMATLPSRNQEAEPGAVASPGKGKGKSKAKGKGRKPRKNQPAFQLEAELERIWGINATSIDGVDVMTIQTVLAEVGPDLSAWKTEGHWASWLNLVPRRDISGGKVIRHVKLGNHNRVGNAFRMCAQSLIRSESYLGAKYRYLRARLGGRRAVKAMARVLACIFYRMVTRGLNWVKRGSEEFEKKKAQRELQSLQRKARDLGLQLIPAV